MTKRTFYFLIFLCLFLGLKSTAQSAEKFDFSILAEIPILDQGRLKPLDSFALESVQEITGKRHYLGKDPLEILILWLNQAARLSEEKIVLSRYEPLNRKIGLPPQTFFISSKELLENKNFKTLLQNILLKQQAGENLNALEKEASALIHRVDLLHRILSGEAWVIFPDALQNQWLSLSELKDPKLLFVFQGLLQAYTQNVPQKFSDLSKELRHSLQKNTEGLSTPPSQKNMKREVCLNHFRPFQKAWIFFVIAFVACLLSQMTGNKTPYLFAWGLSALGLGVSLYGFVLRCLIAGRPPVSNMYESVIWVSFGTVFFALIFEAIYRSRYFLLTGVLGATVGMVLADSLPNVLSPFIQPLVPVLRSNFWLTIHVLTITLSYAAFLLAMVLGELLLGFYAFKPASKEALKNLNLYVYRAIQVGVVLLAAGTILGGVWANASWGRFWGWDPKEVWALIALLGYLAILHGRFTGWVKEFGFAALSVLAFLLVLMAWYGVNFVLGVGLHSYGFSSGGFTQVFLFVILQLAWIGFATWRYRKKPLSD